MPTATQQALALIEFIDRSPTALHAASTVAAALDQAGFAHLDEREAWKLSPGDRAYVVRGGGAIVALCVGDAPPEEAGLSIVGAHTDSPHPRVKPLCDAQKAGCQQLAVEPYGGMLLSTWLDRDLGIAGRVIVSDGHALSSHLIDFHRPVARIANLAIHLDREVNSRGLVVNPQQHLAPIVGLLPATGLRVTLAEELGRAGVAAGPDDILDFDLSLYDCQPGAIGGLRNELVFAPRLDNLASCHAGLTAFLDALTSCPRSPATRLLAFWDHEECGSRSRQGAQGPLLVDTIDRLVDTLSASRQARQRTIARSLLISCDMAHAVHPNYADRHEPGHQPLLGGGPVIKSNSGQSYATDGISAARFIRLCNRAGVGFQRFVTRSDLPCGSTIGPITAALAGIHAVDVGNPMLSMHSAREMAAVADHGAMIDALRCLYEDEV